MISAKFVILLTSVVLNVTYASALEKTLFCMSPDKYTVGEGIGKFDVIVVRDGEDITGPVEIKYETKAGTATSGFDYFGISGVLVFLPGEKKKYITVHIVDDKLTESVEDFFVNLIDIKGGKLGDQKESKVTIYHNDGKIFYD